MKPRNIINPKHIDLWLSQIFQDRAIDPDIQKWFLKSGKKFITIHAELPRVPYQFSPSDPPWMKKAALAGEPFFQFKPNRYLESLFALVLAYLASDKCSPKILRATMPIAIKKAAKWAGKIKSDSSRAEDAGGIEDIIEFKCGYRWVRVLSRKSLMREGELMHNCVAEYHDRIAAGKTMIFSLRDDCNQPHATLEITKHEIVQLKGRYNKPVGPEHAAYIAKFMEDISTHFHHPIGISDDKKSILTDIGRKDLAASGILTGNGKSCHISCIPANFDYPDDLDLSPFAVGWLPEGLKVDGNLDLESCPIRTLPKNLKVDGNLNLRCSKIIMIPPNLEVGGTLILADTEIKRLPNELTIEGSIDLTGCPMECLPKRLSVGEDLYISGTKIRRLPNCLKVGGRIIY